MKKQSSIRNLKNEIWKDIPNFEGLYQVSNFGRVRSFLINKNGKLIKIQLTPTGYCHVCLIKNGKQTRRYVHHLVYEAFVGIIPKVDWKNELEINHKDENKRNNRVENLELVTHKQNANYGTRNKRSSEKNSIPVCQFTLDGVLVKKWDKMRDCSKNGLDRMKISLCCRNKHITKKGNNIYKNYIWKYADKSNASTNKQKH